ncbi:MinD/ParA family ATP-binding protein [Streptomyces sp. LE64]|uniref:MinD/ParA family ATP-binding protein n=1 Tax=Streptomyces sp. LE64 TaxID=3448653 RepID=UPI004041CAEC
MERNDWQAGVLGELGALTPSGKAGKGTGESGGPQEPSARPVGGDAPAVAPAPEAARVPPGGSRGPSPTGPGSAPTPETVPVLGAGAGNARLRHGDPVLRRVLRTARHAFGSSAARAVAESTELVARVQQPVTTGRQVVVTSIRGGAGKTTVTALLSRTFNHFRHDPVLTLEADAALGTLPARLGVDELRWTCTDLARVLHPSMRLTDVTGYLVPLADGGWLLPGSQGRIGARIDIAAYRTATVALRRYFGVTLVDCDTLPGEVARTALDTAQARVLVAPATAEGVASTGAVLDWLGSLPVPALPRTVVVLTAPSPDAAPDAHAAAELARSGAGVVVLPYDRHLASGGVIRTDHLAAATRRAVTRLAAEAMQRAVGAR